MSKQQYTEEEEEYYAEDGPNWTLIIVAYFLLLAVAIVLLRPFHLSMGGIFFAMAAAAIVLAIAIFGGKALLRKLAAMNLSRRDLAQMAIGYNPYEQQEDEQAEAPQAPARFIGKDPLRLSENFQPSFHDFLEAMVLIVGVRRSGKSTLLLTLFEELARYFLPFILFDTQGEFTGLADPAIVPRPRLAGNLERMREVPTAMRDRCYQLTKENAYAFGQAVMSQGLQAVVNLKSFDSDEEAAIIMVEIIDGVNDWEEARGNGDAIPMMFGLDEGPKWLPENKQDKSSDVTPETQKLLEEAFVQTVVERGGKNGLGLVVATQRYSRIKKSLLQSAWKFYLKQTEEIDLARYKQQGVDPEAAKVLRQGEAIAFGPEISSFTFRSRRPNAKHEGHSPDAAALAKHTKELTIEDIARIPGPMDPLPMREQTAERAARPRVKSDLDKVLEVLIENRQAGVNMSYREIGDEVGFGKDKVAKLIEEIDQRHLLPELPVPTK